MIELTEEQRARISLYSVQDFDDEKFAERYWGEFGIENAFSEPPVFKSEINDSLNNYATVDPENLLPFPPQLSDLAVLHFLVVSREVSKVVEFGSGYSTAVLALALVQNGSIHKDWVESNRRLEDPFTLATVDESADWLEITVQRIHESFRHAVRTVHSQVEMVDFCGRYATKYSSFSDVVADLVVIDGPSQYAPPPDDKSFHTGKSHLMPMAADVLPVEHFFEPGSILFLDGRTSNARFLRQNLQRNWAYRHFSLAEFHIFELQEEPLGKINKARLDHIPGRKWLLE